MNIQEMGRLVAEQQRLLREMEPVIEAARQISRQMQPVVDLVHQHEENFRQIAASSTVAADALQVAGIEETVAQWRAALGRDVELLPSEEIARLQEFAATVRRSMPTLPTLAPEMLGGAWNEQLADAAAHLQARTERLAGTSEASAPEDMEALADDIEAVTAATPTEARENVGRWLVVVLCFVLDALALDPAKEIVRDAVAKLLAVLLVIAAEATIPTQPPAPPPVVPEPSAEAAIEDTHEVTRRAISELRRIGGLTWVELGRMFGVSPQCIHAWASGRAPDAGTQQHVLGLLDVIRHADRGDAQSNRTALFEVTDAGTPFDLLASKRFEEARALLGRGMGRRRPKLTELDDANNAERRPPPPEELIDALNDRVHEDLGNGRAACTVRNRRRGRAG